MASNKRDKVFISYAHEDKPWLLRLQKYLRPHLADGQLSVWDDRSLQPGDKWYDGILRAIDDSCVAVLMMSADFLNSDFILNEEIPRLRAAAAEQELTILWIAVKPAEYSIGFADLQALNNPAAPLSTLGEADQDQLFVKLSSEIKRRFVEQTRQRVIPIALADQLGNPVRTFAVRSSDGPCLVDERSQLWVMEGQQIRLFSAGQVTPQGREVLPSCHWKSHLPCTWRDRVVMSDWGGSLYAFDGKAETREAPFYEARHDDLPIHRLSVGRQGHLFAAAWNGVVRRWEPDGICSSGSWPLHMPDLPLLLAPLGDGGLAVGTQAGEIYCYTAAAAPAWKFKPGRPISQLWSGGEDDNPHTVIAQLGDRRLVHIADGRVIDTLDLDSPITAVASRQSEARGHVAAVACQSGVVEWVLLPTFARLETVHTDLVARQIVVIPHWNDDGHLLAAGLSEDQRLFTIDEGSVRRFEQPSEIRKLLVDRLGRLLFLVFDKRIDVFLNPAMPKIPCRVEVADDIQGRLKLNTFRKLAVRLKNVGLIPIHRLQLEFAPSDDVQAHSVGAGLREPLAPGASIDVDFSLRAKVTGEVPLRLKALLTDEGDWTTTFEKTLYLPSED